VHGGWVGRRVLHRAAKHKALPWLTTGPVAHLRAKSLDEKLGALLELGRTGGRRCKTSMQKTRPERTPQRQRRVRNSTRKRHDSPARTAQATSTRDTRVIMVR
jgi:hypothetical protein